MTTFVAPLLVLLVLAAAAALVAPALGGRARNLRTVAHGIAATVTRTVRRRLRPRDGTRLNRLSRVIRDDVTRYADRTLNTRILPDVVQVELAPEDAELLRRHHGVLENELNEHWAAMATREGWQYPGFIELEFTTDPDHAPGRPRLQLRYGITGEATAQERDDDGVPLATGWFVVTADRVVPVPVGGLTLGRNSSCDVVVADGNASRRHVRLTVLADARLRVKDLRSKNGTFVDNEQIDERVLDGTVELRLGKEHRLRLVRR